MKDCDCEVWSKQVLALGVEPFLTDTLDIEGVFIKSSHLSYLNAGYTEIQFEELFKKVEANHKSEFVEEHISRVVENERKMDRNSTLNIGSIGANAWEDICADKPSRLFGKKFLRRLRYEFQRDQSKNLKVWRQSKYLRHSNIEAVVKKAFGRKRNLSSEF